MSLKLPAPSYPHRSQSLITLLFSQTTCFSCCCGLSSTHHLPLSETAARALIWQQRSARVTLSRFCKVNTLLLLPDAPSTINNNILHGTTSTAESHVIALSLLIVIAYSALFSRGSTCVMLSVFARFIWFSFCVFFNHDIFLMLHTHLNHYLAELQFLCIFEFRHNQDNNDLLLTYPSNYWTLYCVRIVINNSPMTWEHVIFYFASKSSSYQ